MSLRHPVHEMCVREFLMHTQYILKKSLMHTLNIFHTIRVLKASSIRIHKMCVGQFLIHTLNMLKESLTRIHYICVKNILRIHYKIFYAYTTSLEKIFIRKHKNMCKGILNMGWQRPIGCLKLQVIFCKRATNYGALLRKMTYKDKASYGSSLPYIYDIVPCHMYTHTLSPRHTYTYVYIHTHTYIFMYDIVPTSTSCPHTHKHTRTRIYKHTHTHTHTQIYIHEHVYIHTYTYV